MEGDHVAGADELIEIDQGDVGVQPDLLVVEPRVVGHDLRTEGGHQARDRAADRTEPHDPDLARTQLSATSGRPVSLSDRPISDREVA